MDHEGTTRTERPDSVNDLWNKPNDFCGQCGAPLNEYCVGGYILHDSEHAVSWATNAKKTEILAAIEASVRNANALREYLNSGRHIRDDSLPSCYEK
jgi:hypothetical protein